MININQAKEVFLEYVEKYDASNPKIARKIEHTLRTADVARKIAEGLNLEKEDVELASLIGLLHDIGRFNQIKKFDTYNDSISIDHAGESNRVLFEEKYIRKFIDAEKYDEIIKKAICNHNKATIEDGLDEKELLHAKIIRDADKTDIYEVFERENSGWGLYNYEEIGKYKISDLVYNEMKKCRQIDRKILTNELEWYISNLSYTFDYNFKPGLEIIKEKDYIRHMVARIKGKTEENEKKIDEIQEILLNYIDKRLSE